MSGVLESHGNIRETSKCRKKNMRGDLMASINRADPIRPRWVGG